MVELYLFFSLQFHTLRVEQPLQLLQQESMSCMRAACVTNSSAARGRCFAFNNNNHQNELHAAFLDISSRALNSRYYTIFHRFRFGYSLRGSFFVGDDVLCVIDLGMTVSWW